MHLRLAILAVIGPLSACQIPRPIDSVAYVANCSTNPERPDQSARLFLTLRLPDCRKGKTTLTNRRTDKVRFASSDGKAITFVQEDAWLDALAERVENAGQSPPVIFIHGYNNSNTDALDRAAKISMALGHDRIVVALTWPSFARKTGYFWDEADAEWAAKELPGMLAPLLVRFHRISIIAHSMGNRLALAEVARLRADGQLGNIQQLVMGAPDLDRQEFAKLLSEPGGIGIRPTIYVSTRDQALSSSWRGHGYARAGDFSWWVTGHQPYYAFAWLPADVIDTAPIDKSWLGHSAFIDTRQGAVDLCRVIHNSGGRGIEHRANTPDNYFELIGYGIDDACYLAARPRLAP